MAQTNHNLQPLLNSSRNGNADVAVIVLPLLAQGHLNQFLHLSGLLATHGLEVHYVTSACHFRQVVDRCANNGHRSSIEFHGFTLPFFASPPPDPNSTLKFPAHLQPAFDAAANHLKDPLSTLLHSLTTSRRRIIIIHDSLMSFAVGVAAPFCNVETFAFHTVSALCLLNHFHQTRSNDAKNFDCDEPLYPSAELSNISIKDCFTDEFLNFISRQHNYAVGDSGRLLNTFPLIEHKFIKLLHQEPRWKNQKIFAVGPLNPVKEVPTNNNTERHECLQWLDKQPQSSVVFVSFGTTSAISDEQIKELAMGLAASKQRFLWVLRDADRGEIYAQSNGAYQENKLSLPLNYEEMVQGVGKVVRGWVPQLDILAHKSTAAFMSHCGWNSCMESITNGVSILAWPMHSDQPANAVLVTKVLGIGVFVREWSKRNEVLKSKAIAEAVERFMGSEEGIEVRKKARVLGNSVREVTNNEELDAFIEHITRL